MRRIGMLAVLAALAYGAAESAAPATSTPRRTLAESADHHAVRVRRGTEIVVRLHNTYWSFHRVDGSTLRSLGAPVYSAAGAGRCVPGAGCGTVTARYRAQRDGSATIRAGRITCGEVLLCAPSQRTFTVKVTVTG